MLLLLPYCCDCLRSRARKRQRCKRSLKKELPRNARSFCLFSPLSTFSDTVRHLLLAMASVVLFVVVFSCLASATAAAIYTLTVYWNILIRQLPTFVCFWLSLSKRSMTLLLYIRTYIYNFITFFFYRLGINSFLPYASLLVFPSPPSCLLLLYYNKLRALNISFFSWFY